MTLPIEILSAALDNRTASVGVIGLGYVGLPLTFAVRRAGFSVIGFDVNPARVEGVKRGEHLINYIDAELFRRAAADPDFAATTDMSRLGEADVLVICVPTPLTRHKEPDLTFVRATGEAIAGNLRPGQLVILESTTWPGTTREVLQPLLETGGLVCGRDFFLAFSPEREDPGNDRFATASIPKVVGADDLVSSDLATRFYGAVVERVVPVQGAATAEAVKLTENIFRAVNIALVNELKTVYEALDVDVWEVIDAAATKPFGFMPFYPGPGLGGHCIPIDPFYLTWKAREHGVETRFIELAGLINTRMPKLVVDRLQAALAERRSGGLTGARVLVLGLAYKKNINDLRESPALELIELIEERGGHTAYHDPHIPRIPPTREHTALAGRESVALDAETLGGFDAVLLATDHDDVDYPLVVHHSRLIIDTRNGFASRGLSSQLVIKA